MATSAATTYFEPVAIGSCHYVDGALRHNNPVLEVEAEAQDIWSSDQGNLKPLVKCFLSIGTGTPEAAALSNNWVKLAKSLTSIVTDTEEANKTFQNLWRRHMKDNRMFRFDVAKGLEKVRLDGYEQQGTIEAATKDYLDNRVQQFKLQACAENLMEKNCTPLDFHKTVSTYQIRVSQGGYDPEEVRDCCSILRVTNVEKDRNDLKRSKGSRVPGTFEWITSNESYQNWQNSGPDTLWVSAGPGRGKTMLSLYILEDLERSFTASAIPLDLAHPEQLDKKVELYYFFCSSQDGSRRGAVAVLRNLIYQIIVKHDDLTKYVLDFLQPMTVGPEQYLNTHPPSDIKSQHEKETETAQSLGKSEEQSQYAGAKSSVMNRLPGQSTVRNIFRSRATAKEQSENDTNIVKEKQLENDIEDRQGNQSPIFELRSGKPPKHEQSQGEREEQRKAPQESRLDDSSEVPQRASPKSRQLELLGAGDLVYILRRLILELDADKAFFLLDGVDECVKGEQDTLISMLLSLSDVKPGKFKLLMVSRPIGGMGATPTIKLEEDTTRDVEKYVSQSVQRLANVDGFNEDIRKVVEHELLERAEGTFLWISLVMPEIERKKTCTEILATVRSTHQGLSNTYRRMLQQIDGEHVQKVNQILHWVTAAIRPLTLQELSEIIEHPSGHVMSPEQAVREAVKLCEGLIEARQNDVAFIHTSAKEFLLHGKTEDDGKVELFHKDPQTLHYEIAQACYNTIRDSNLSRVEVKVSDLSDQEEPKLLKYAITHWMEHIKASDWAEKNFDPNADFFRIDSKLRKNWWTAYLDESQKDEPKNFNLSSLLHLAAYFGIVPWVKQAFDGKSWIAKQGTILTMEMDHYYRTPLHIAVEQGHGPIVSLLLEQGIETEWKEASMFATPLHLAARNGHRDICEILLNNKNHKTKVNARNRFESTPLTEAARGGHMGVVKLLVARGADVNGSIDKQSRSLWRQVEFLSSSTVRAFGSLDGPTYEQQSTPIIEAARRNHADVIKYLADNKAEIEVRTLSGRNALQVAAFDGQLKSMEALVSRHANVNSEDKWSQTALLLASWQNHPDAVQWLLSHGANIDAPNKWGLTPLIVAARFGHTKPMRILLEAEANRELEDHNGYTALALAAFHGHVAAVRLLIEHKADVNARNKLGDTAMMQAIRKNLTDDYVEIVQLLVKSGANAELPNQSGVTPLMKAAEVSEGDAGTIVEHLLQNGAAVDAKDHEGRTALMRAILGGSRTTHELLIDQGADLEDRDALGVTSLILAAGYSDRNTVEFLLDRGADIEARDNFGLTPLMKAGKCGTADTVNLLLDRGAKITAVDTQNKEALDHVATRNRGDIIKILTSRGADRRKLTMLNWAAEGFSGSMHWTVETCRKWESDWEDAELKKLKGIPGEQGTDGTGFEEKETPPAIGDVGTVEVNTGDIKTNISGESGSRASDEEEMTHDVLASSANASVVEGSERTRTDLIEVSSPSADKTEGGQEA
ncbi:MAG: hypothetical protein Q9195_000117 [Heterodermia aff. obscurata]